MNAPRILIRRTRRGRFVWNLVASNGKVTANNQRFPSRGNAARSAKAVVSSVFKLAGVSVGFKSRTKAGETQLFVVVRAVPSELSKLH